MLKRVLLALVVGFLTVNAWAAGNDRAWQTGIWRDVKVVRPKVIFGIAPRNPSDGGVRPAPPAVRETRLYVIETDDWRLELKQDATADAPRVDAMVNAPVTFAIEKNTIYIKDAEGHEHKLSLTKKLSRK
jgi:hypothetical protein